MAELPQRVLVTGCAGFIGSHVAERLVQEGVRVIGVDNFDPYYDRQQKESHLAKLLRSPEFRFEDADIRNGEALLELLRSEPIEAVIHLAARAGVRASIRDPETYFSINLSGTLQLLEAMRRAEVRQMVFGSSSSVYGRAPVPFSEEHPADRPLQPYGASKRAAEILAHTYAHLYGMQITVTRFFSAYGPRLRPDLVIHKFARLIARGEEVPILGDGTAARDYTYIDDIVDGVIAALERPFRYEIINLGNSRTVPLNRVIELLEQHLGRKALRRYLPPNPGDMPITYADLSKAKRLLGYAPRVPFEEGIARFVEWFKTLPLE
ncbi:MAG: epimerase [Candidatus Poribacteria bacterium]|nr:MAG: epimerase [Candidatus Poribacteria bacterium]